MQLFDLTTTVSEDGTRIVSVAGRIADRQPSEQQKEWIAFQLLVDLPTVRNGALLRKEVLQSIRDKVAPLIQHFDNLGRDR